MHGSLVPGATRQMFRRAAKGVERAGSICPQSPERYHPEAARGLGLIYKFGRRTPLRIDPVPAGWLGVSMPLDHAGIHDVLADEIRTGSVGRRDGMQAQRAWIDIKCWNPILANRLKSLIDTAYQKVGSS